MTEDGVQAAMIGVLVVWNIIQSNLIHALKDRVAALESPVAAVERARKETQ